MGAFTQADRDAIQYNSHSIRLNQESIGVVKRGSMQLSLKGQYYAVEDVEGFRGPFKMLLQGVVPEFKATVKSNDINFLVSKFMANQTNTTIYGAHLGVQDTDLSDIEEELLLHPLNKADTDRSADILMYKAIPIIDFNLVLGGENPSEVDVTFRIMPDITRNDGEQYGFLGDWTQTASAPDGVIITTDRTVRAPYLSLKAATLAVYEVQRVFAFAFYFTMSAVTCALNDAGDMTSSDVAVTFDALSVAGAIAAGTILRQGSGPYEYLYVRSVSYDAGNVSGTAQCVRGIAGSAATSISDNDVFTLVSSTAIEACRDKATWASSATSYVTVGNLLFNSDFTENKGQLDRIATGSANITATLSAVSSPNLVLS